MSNEVTWKIKRYIEKHYQDFLPLVKGTSMSMEISLSEFQEEEIHIIKRAFGYYSDRTESVLAKLGLRGLSVEWKEGCFLVKRQGSK
ncbi:MAG: hypothetical protein PHN39_01305 [Candidatus Pacebacteria bacterium]|nr:hypothetical protein [Candidatus Paceibacterota bacterium]